MEITFSFIFSFSAASISATFSMESTLTLVPMILILSWSMGVLAHMILAFSMRVGHPTEMDFSKMNPSLKKESLMLPPGFLII